MERLKRRQDFVAAARALSEATPGMVVQARNRLDIGGPRLGFTCSKKIGNAVIRNRSKRRMREVARLVLANTARSENCPAGLSAPGGRRAFLLH